ncbi:Septum formation protein Maf [hydrothermal vent metagenome]|uniref:Septum formation protein Maf n=1 Tax=hydrothermal vent metagenome TaxID=652676 RepID=A0A1W1D0I3_9ZZZZ
MIYLCSSSPSRALLLEKFGVKFEQKSAYYDEEQITTSIAKDFVYTASKGKLESAIKAFGLETPLLCADTVIASSDGQILRKPKNKEDAKRILRLQSNSKISIISSVHYQSKTQGFSNISATHYLFNCFDEVDLDAYLESGLWQGKAGGCMVEGFCKKYILEVDGFESTAMGLQVEEVLPWLEV